MEHWRLKQVIIAGYNLKLRCLFFSTLLLIGFLELDGQSAPESLDYSPTHVRISNAHNSSELRVLKGEIADHDLAHNSPAIIGTVNRDDAFTTFSPIVPFDQETPYTLVYDGQIFHFEIARPGDQPIMMVNEIYPSAKEVPANILKWYIQFSQPVNPVKIYEHINFLDQHGKLIDRSILHLGAPLLSEDGTLLTVWVEPGRQKQLLGPNQHLGSVFEPHQQYTLYIANTLKDAQGVPIAKSVRHTFTTIEADRIKPALSNWNIAPLKVDTRQPLAITSNEHLDYGSLLDALRVLLDGDEIVGTLSYDNQTATIHFTPTENWKKGTYTVQLAYQLEDLAGNNLKHLFDRPLHKEQDELRAEQLTLSVDCN